jgi:enterochelin esterase-like enzyme
MAIPAALAGQGKLVNDSVTSPGLAINVVGDPAVRPVVIYLPPSYHTQSARRYPVLYMLHGATSKPEEWLDGKSYQGMNLKLLLDSLIIAHAIPEMIVVMPNADNAFGSDWYANSPALGNWEDFVVRDVVGHVDSRYRTEPRRTGRALFGHSMGGFGALAIGFRHPEIFGLVYASSPAYLALAGPLGRSGAEWRGLAALTRWQDGVDQLTLSLGLAAALDGDPRSPRLFSELPYNVSADGTLLEHPDVLARWLARMPPALATNMVRRGARPPLLMIEAGNEEAVFLEGIDALRARLDSLKVPYADSVFVGGHVDQVRERMTHHMLPAIGSWFARDSGR